MNELIEEEEERKNLNKCDIRPSKILGMKELNKKINKKKNRLKKRETRK